MWRQVVLSVFFALLWLVLSSGRIFADAVTLDGLTADEVGLIKAPEFRSFMDTLKQAKVNYLYKDKLNAKLLFTGAAIGAIDALGDRHSIFIPLEERDSYVERSSLGEFDGYGITFEVVDGASIINSVMPESSAEKAGIKSKDVMTTVNGKKVRGLTTSEISAMINGKKEQSVNLRVFRPSANKFFTFSIKKEHVVAKLVLWKWLEPGIAHITIEGFQIAALAQFDEALAAISSRPLSGVILDLRGNPGGENAVLLDILCNFLEPKQLVCCNVYSNGQITKEYPIRFERERQRLKTQSYPNEGILKRVKVVCLINKTSCSCAEVMIGALRDHRKIMMVGESTYGKGCGQAFFETDLGMIRLTVGKWVTPNGYDVQGVGLKPDYEIKDSAEQIKKALSLLK